MQGGGYTIRNVARCWAYETSVLLDNDIPDDANIPPNDFYEYYAPDYKLHLTVGTICLHVRIYACMCVK